jgi:transcriptional regulator with XRE-family HTH domain
MSGRAPHGAYDFRAWRKRMGWTQQQAADALSLSRRGYQIYEKGYAGLFPRNVPRPVVALATLIEDKQNPANRS